MLKKNINFYIATLLITILGSAATLVIVEVGTNATIEKYGTQVGQGGEVPALKQELKKP